MSAASKDGYRGTGLAVLEKFGVELLGASLEAIHKAAVDGVVDLAAVGVLHGDLAQAIRRHPGATLIVDLDGVHAPARRTPPADELGLRFRGSDIASHVVVRGMSAKCSSSS